MWLLVCSLVVCVWWLSVRNGLIVWCCFSSLSVCVWMLIVCENGVGVMRWLMMCIGMWVCVRFIVVVRLVGFVLMISMGGMLDSVLVMRILMICDYVSLCCFVWWGYMLIGWFVVLLCGVGKYVFFVSFCVMDFVFD